MKFAEWLKMWTALAGGVATGALGLTDLPASWKLPLELVVVSATAAGVWKVENKPVVPPAVPYTHEGPGTLH